MKKRHTEKQIVIKLREIDILLGQGKTVGEACRYPNPTWKAPDTCGSYSYWALYQPGISHIPLYILAQLRR